MAWLVWRRATRKPAFAALYSGFCANGSPSRRRFFNFASNKAVPSEPQVPARPATRGYKEKEWVDEYSWLESGSAAVQKVLQQERRYAEAWLQRSAVLAHELRGEMLQLVPPAQTSVPERVGGWEYYVQQLPDRPHPCYMRRAIPPGSDTHGQQQVLGQRRRQAEVLLDVNELALVHGEYVQVGQMKLSQCGQQLAFTLEAGDGEESFAAFTRDLRTGTLRQVSALGSVVSLEWAADGATLLATQPNELGRPWRVVGCHAAGTAAAGGAAGRGGSRRGSGGGSWVLFDESDERFFVELGRTKDWSFLTINCNSKAASEVHLLPANLRHHQQQQRWRQTGPAATSAAAEPRLVQPRTAGLEYFVEHNSGQLYMLSNAHGAHNYAVYRVPAASASLSQEHWQLVVPEQQGTAIEDMDMTQDWLVLYQRQQGRQQVAALPLRHGLPAAVPGAAVAVMAADAALSAGSGLPAAAATAAVTAPPAVAAAAGGAAAAPTASVAAADQLQVAPLPDWALSVVAGANADFHSQQLRLMLSSPVHLEATFDWDLARQRLVARSSLGALAVMKGQQQQEEQQQQQEEQQQGSSGVASLPQPQQRQQQEQGLDNAATAAGYAWHQLWATSADGTMVPLTVAHAVGLPLPGSSSHSDSSSHGHGYRCLLVVYGAYGHCLPTYYLAERIPLLRRGWVLALAHVRGGGELGRRWHAGGRGAAKANSVLDLEACLDRLVAAGYTRRGLVALEAHSAGGLTAGALLNRRPADLGAALLEAPFVDVLSAMCQPDLLLTVHEYEEWGDPSDPSQFEQIRQLCPYQTVQPASYPPVLLTCSQQDLRVPYWGPLKHAARLRAAQRQASSGGGGSSRRGGGGPILLLPDGQTGHFVHERDLFETKAQQYAFLISQIEQNVPAGR